MPSQSSGQSDVFFRVSLPASQDLMVFCQASGREEAKRLARQYLGHDPDRYIVEPLTQSGAEVHVTMRPQAVVNTETRSAEAEIPPPRDPGKPEWGRLRG